MAQKFTWIASNEIITEYTEVIDRHYGPSITQFVIESLINAHNFSVYEPSYKWQLIPKDPDDNKFVDCAVGSSADFLVSDDKHILELAKIPDLFPPIPIISFEQFKARLELYS